jgi:methyl-accepting chemotaxis protein
VDDKTKESLINAGWISPEIAAELYELFALIGQGQYMSVPSGQDTMGKAVRKLSVDVAKKNAFFMKETVAVSMQLNEAVIAAANLLKAASHTDENAQAMASATEELSSSVQMISTEAQKTQSITNNVEKLAKQGSQLSNKVEITMTEVEEAMADITNRSENLSQSSNDIGDIVGLISEIAFQTNLLAINAAVEAAHAGESGKGFAVVASEIRQLAERTKDATNNIRSQISSFQKEINAIVDVMDESNQKFEIGHQTITESQSSMQSVEKAVTDLNVRMNEISNIIIQQQSASQGIAENITQVAGMTSEVIAATEQVLDSMDSSETHVVEQINAFAELELPKKALHLAKSDHVIWKKKLASMLAGRTALDPNELADHTCCRLGKWYYACDDDRILSNTAFNDIEDPHILVHKHGIEAARLYNEGQLDHALEEVKKVQDASKDVIHYLNELTKKSQRSG